MMEILGIVTFLFCLTGAFANCGDPPAIDHTTNNLSGSASYAEGTDVSYSCDIGYRADGYRSVYTCTNGAWTGGPFYCVEILCTFLSAPTNGYISNQPTYKIASKITFACDEGYNMVGRDSLRCNIDGWTPSETPPRCVAKDCGEFGQIQNAEVFQEAPDGVMNDYNSAVSVTCHEGYTLSGVATVYCEADGSWGPKPQCILSQCPDYPGLEYSKCIENSFVSNTMLYLQCIDDADRVTKIGGDSTMCLEGQWDDPSLRCYCNCECKASLTSVVYNNCNTKGYLAHDSQLSWGCKPGFHRNSTASIRCADGVWSREPVCEANPTARPTAKPTAKPTLPPSDNDCKIIAELNHGTYGNVRLEGHLRQGHELEYECDYWYKKSSEQKITCKEGRLSSKPSCKSSVVTIILMTVLIVVVIYLLIALRGMIWWYWWQEERNYSCCFSVGRFCFHFAFGLCICCGLCSSPEVKEREVDKDPKTDNCDIETEEGLPLHSKET